jgi:hypothetical protein
MKRVGNTRSLFQNISAKTDHLQRVKHDKTLLLTRDAARTTNIIQVLLDVISTFNICQKYEVSAMDLDIARDLLDVLNVLGEAGYRVFKRPKDSSVLSSKSSVDKQEGSEGSRNQFHVDLSKERDREIIMRQIDEKLTFYICSDPHLRSVTYLFCTKVDLFIS